jgi:hypothetical protein
VDCVDNHWWSTVSAAPDTIGVNCITNPWYNNYMMIWTYLPIVEDGTIITWGPVSPSSSKWARKAMVCMVFPKPWRTVNRLDLSSRMFLRWEQTYKLYLISSRTVIIRWLIALKTLNYLAFQSFDFEHTWWRLFQKCVVHIKFDICVFISFSNSRPQWSLVFIIDDDHHIYHKIILDHKSSRSTGELLQSLFLFRVLDH